MGFKKLCRACLLCGHCEGQVLHRQEFLVEQGNPLPPSYDVVACAQCGTVFADVEATQLDYDLYYATFSNYEDTNVSSGSALSGWDRRRLSVTAQAIADAHPSRPALRVLDIGSAQGGLLTILAGHGYHNLYALEPSRSCVDRINGAPDRLVTAYNGGVYSDFEAIFGVEKFDVIVLSHVLEHLYEVHAAIRNVTRILAPGGSLYIEVPDAARYAEFYKAPFHYFDVEHINHFDLTSLNAAFALNGYDAVTSGAKEIEVAPDELYPAIFSVFRRREATRKVQGYVAMSQLSDNSALFRELREKNTPVAVWGVGSYTKRLLAATGLKDCNIQLLIDLDINKKGKLVHNIAITPPESLAGFEGVILISSAIYSKDILNDIRGRNIQNETVVLK